MKNKYKTFYLALFFFIGFAVHATPNYTGGTIIDLNGNPVSGAKITLIKSPTTYSFTNKNGVFKLDAIDGDIALITTTSNFSKQVTLISGQTIVLDKVSSPVDNGLGIVKNRGKSTASTSVVFSDRLEKSSAHFNPSNALFGELLGLNVFETSGVNENKRAKLNMRGIGRPMVLVDGFERDINDLNVEEIESVTLLKDAASLAMYGFRGSNGVLLVTTKRGKYNTVEISFNYEDNIHLSNPVIPMANAYTYAMAVNEGLMNDGSDPQYNNYQLDAYKNGNQPLIYPNVNWANETLTKMSLGKSYNMQVKGGGEIIRYFVSMGYDTNEGFIGIDTSDKTIPNQYLYSNLNVRTNLDIEISPKTLLSLNLLGKLKETSSPMLSSSNLMKVIYNTPASAFPVETINGEHGSSTIWTKNPVADLKNAGFYKYHNRTLLADIKIVQNLESITKGLNAEVRLAYDSDANFYERKRKKYRTETTTQNFDNLGNPLDVIYNQIGENDGSYNFSHWLSSQWQKTTVQGLINYQKSFYTSKFKIGYMTEISSIVDKGIQKTYNRVNNSIFTSYSFDERFLIDASFTVASSNILNPKRKWGYFPAVSAAWIISNEEFLKQSEVIDYLKLRGSWGLLGNDSMAFDNYRQEYRNGGAVLFGNFNSVSTLKTGTLPVHNLTYAKTSNFNIGVEGTLWGGFDFTAELYYNSVYDILSQISNVNSSVLGINPGFANNGKKTYKGLELGLGYRKIGKDLKYAFNGKLAFNRSKITQMNERTWKNNFNRATGHPVGQIFGFEADGFFKDQEDINNSPVQTFSEVQPGDVKYIDQDGNNIIDQYDRVAIGYSSYMPELYFSFDCNLEYKNVGMSLLFQGISNYSTILNTPSIYRPITGNKNISQHYYDNRWTASNTESLYPRLTNETNQNNSKNSTVWLQDLSYLKLRTAELYFKLPEVLIQKTKLTNAKLFLRGYNIFSLDKMRVGDPESIGIGYPMHLTVNVGVKLSF